MIRKLVVRKFDVIFGNGFRTDNLDGCTRVRIAVLPYPGYVPTLQMVFNETLALMWYLQIFIIIMGMEIT